MPRFVVLTHDHPFPHWDLLLECGRTCRAWRLLKEPSLDRHVPAEPLPDHRPYYLTYEGPVSGGRGTVARWDTGTFEWIHDEPGAMAVELSGSRLQGTYFLMPHGDGWRAGSDL